MNHWFRYWLRWILNHFVEGQIKPNFVWHNTTLQMDQKNCCFRGTPRKRHATLTTQSNFFTFSAAVHLQQVTGDYCCYWIGWTIKGPFLIYLQFKGYCLPVGFLSLLYDKKHKRALLTHSEKLYLAVVFSALIIWSASCISSEVHSSLLFSWRGLCEPEVFCFPPNLVPKELKHLEKQICFPSSFSTPAVHAFLPCITFFNVFLSALKWGSLTDSDRTGASYSAAGFWTTVVGCSRSRWASGKGQVIEKLGIQ